MPFLGVQPSKGLVGSSHIDNDALDSQHYANASIDTAHIAANQIDGTLTKDALIADYSDVTITASDLIMYGDATDSNNTKRDTVQGILDLAGGITLATRQASTSGTSIDFTGIPAGTKRITVMYRNVGTNNSSDALVIQIGDAGGLETGSYVCGSGKVASDTSTRFTNGFALTLNNSGAQAEGQYVLNLQNASDYSWVGHGAMHETGGNTTTWGAGGKSLSAELDRLSIIGSAGGTFDNGTVNISYE
tara:strand:- start:4590 stop:5330 length:741 start_codon:yes stop_codon:yes gene_type:complete